MRREQLAVRARSWGVHAVYTSAEPKARSTALLLGDELLAPVHVVDGFEELRFDHWIANSDDFAESVHSILEQPALSFRGAETADAAAARFAAAIQIVASASFPAAVVSHGRVLSAWLARVLGPDAPFDALAIDADARLGAPRSRYAGRGFTRSPSIRDASRAARSNLLKSGIVAGIRVLGYAT